MENRPEGDLAPHGDPKPEGEARRRVIELAAPTADQLQAITEMQEAFERYDSSVIVGGPRRDTAIEQ